MAISNYLRLYNSISLSLTVDLQSCEMERNSCEIGSQNGITCRRKEPPNYIIHFRDLPISITIKRVISGHRRSINRRISTVGFEQKKKVKAIGAFFRRRPRLLFVRSCKCRIHRKLSDKKRINDSKNSGWWWLPWVASSKKTGDPPKDVTMTKRERELAGDRSLRTWERFGIDRCIYIHDVEQRRESLRHLASGCSTAWT